MSINDFIFNKAISDIWANPHGDRNVFFDTVRMTGPNGVLGTLDLPFNTFRMPSSDIYYSVYELGGVIPANLGLDEKLLGWVPLRTILNKYQTMVSIFTEGRMAILDTCYIMQTDTKNIIIAVAHSRNKLMLKSTAPVYVRFYSNIFYSGNSPTVEQKLSSNSFIIDSSDIGSYLAFSLEIDTITTLTGSSPLIYLDGLYLPDGLPAHSSLINGVTIEYISDPFLTRRNSLVISELEAFTSIIDSTNKVIASLPNTADSIYVDDIEFYITGIRGIDGLRVGAYFPRLNANVIRMLTFKDWSLNVAMLAARSDELRDFIDSDNTLSDIHLEIIHRENSEYRPRLLDTNYIIDLMNLPLNIRVQALTGVNSTLEIWKAKTLETSAFVKWLGLESDNLTLTNLEGVYTRDAIVSSLERVHLLPDTGEWALPPGASNGGGILAKLLTNGFGLDLVTYDILDHGNEPYINGKGYEIFYPGFKASDPLDVVIPAGTSANTVVENGFGIFCYYDVGGILTYANHGSDYTLVDDDVAGTTTIVWLSALHQYERYVRIAQRKVIFSKSITLIDLQNGIDIYDGRAKTNDIGMGHLYVWAGGNFMIEGLDYIVKDSLIYLVSNHSYFIFPMTIDVIYTGLPDPSLKHIPKGIWGWVKYGRISIDDGYNLFNKRNKLFFIGGGGVPIDEILSDERYIDVTGITPHIDGNPFVILPIVQFSRDEEIDLTAPTQLTTDNTELQITNYLSTIYPQNTQTGLIAIPSKYDLVSVFMDKIIDEISLGNIVVTSTDYSDEIVSLLTANYVNLLDIDVTQLNHDLNFVEIHPRWDSTPQNVTLFEFNFISRVNEFILDDQVFGLNLYLNII